jgi:hypothetical protein
MIGPSNRVAGAHSPQIETALALTAPGQATWADLAIPHTCGDCAHWAELKGRANNMGRCREYATLMQGRPGQPIQRKQQACGVFELAEKAAAR